MQLLGSRPSRVIPSALFAAALVAAVLVAAVPSSAAAQPAVFPSDSSFAAIECLNPMLEPSQDSCTDEARDHRNIVGAGTTPAYLTTQDGTNLYFRIRVEADPRQLTAFRAFAWGFGLDTDGDGAFEAYVTLDGTGGGDHVRVIDQDASNGTSPTVDLLPVSTVGGLTWATATAAPGVVGPPARANFCLDDGDTGDWYITVAVPLSTLSAFGALGGAIAYGGSSSNSTGIQNDIVCFDGNPPSCTTGAMCPSGVCLTGTGVCGPPIAPVFLGCTDDTISGRDSGCAAASPHCLVSATTSTCVACLVSADCNDANACTTDSCAMNACLFAPDALGATCPGGVCNGDASAPACVACIDDVPGTAQDSGCPAGAPVCIVSGATRTCGGCSDSSDCNDGNACTADVCTAGTCSRAPLGIGTGCAGGVCNGSVADPACVACADDAPGTLLDAGCAAGAPICDTSGPVPTCVACTSALDCDDGNGCTTDACTPGGCATAPLIIGTPCVGGVCDGSGAATACVACLDTAVGTMLDLGCTAGAPVCDGTGAAARCVGCAVSADCDDLDPCTSDACVLGVCTPAPLPTGESCPGGVCDGAAAPACVACIDDASGAGEDSGCVASTPMCDSSGVFPICVACTTDAHCDDGNTCTTDACTAGACTVTPQPIGASCVGGVCDGSTTAPLCIACLDDASGVGQDSGCSAGAPVCDTTGAVPVCTGCLSDADCADTNECTDDTCVSGTCVPVSEPAGTACAGGVCDGATTLPACVLCLDDAADTLLDTGCSAGAPICDSTGGAAVCVACTLSSQCDDGNECTRDVCASGACEITPADSGTACSAGVCDGSAIPVCVACIDDAAGADRDTGCGEAAALCDTSGAAAACLPCIDLGDGIDLGCGVPNEVCVASGPTRVCIACEDTASGAGTDFGCDVDRPICGLLEGAPGCAECLIDGDCGLGGACNVVSGTCVPGCDEASDCAAPTPACDLGSGMCVECVLDAECPGRQLCGAGSACRFPDSDGDGIDDDVDLDDDGDGIPDAAELGGTDRSGDDDGDGVQDFEDPDAVDCGDADGDGLCDVLPEALDADGDGRPNHLDLDADGDGLTDLREGGGIDADGDGLVDGPLDADGNGLDDRLMASPLPLPNSDGAEGPDFLDLDADDDGVSDVVEAGGVDSNGDGRAEGPDADGDGLVSTVDPDEGGSPWAGPDTDGDGTPDWRDADDDGDGVSSRDEDLDADGDPRDDDTDGDGTPNYLDPDDDDDDIATRDEDTNDNGDWTDDDVDGDGIPDYLDPLEVTPTLGGLSGGALCTVGHGGSAGSLSLWVLALIALAARRRRPC